MFSVKQAQSSIFFSSNLQIEDYMGIEGRYHLNLPDIKVHRLMCLELKKFLDRISRIYSEVESARPRCATGLQALCSLHVAVDKAQLLIQHCSECSKLYLALTADKILRRCENIRKTLELCLVQIQNMVPILLAAKVSGITEDLRIAKFTIEFSEAEAGRVVKELLMLDMPASDSEFEALQFAAVRLKITSSLAVLMEKRAIKKLHGKVRETDPKRKILDYFLYLLWKYGTLIGQHKTADHSALHKYKPQTENSATPEPPLQFKCPISERVMYDPVVIASGKTFERAWIEKWFQEGNNTCPKTQMRLDNFYLTPDVLLKDLILKWCSNHGLAVPESCPLSIPAPVHLQKFSSFRSTASLASSLNDLRLQVISTSFRSSDTNSCDYSLDDDSDAMFGVEIPRMKTEAFTSDSSMGNSDISSLKSLSKLDLLPWESQCKVVKDFKEKVEKFETAGDWTFNSISVKPLVRFLVEACKLSDVKLQNDSAEILLSILCKTKTELPSFDKDAICMLASVLDSEISGKVLEIMQELSDQPLYKARILACGVLPAILEILQSHIKAFQELALKIICNLSYNNNIAYHIVYLDCITKLVPFLGDRNLSGYCLKLMNILSGIKEGRTAMAETSTCMGSIAELVKTGNNQEQETAMEIVQSLLNDEAMDCQQVIADSIIQALSSISVNGNSRRKVIATELLQILGHTAKADACDGSGLGVHISSHSGNHPKAKNGPSNGQKFQVLGFSFFILKKKKDKKPSSFDQFSPSLSSLCCYQLENSEAERSISWLRPLLVKPLLSKCRAATSSPTLKLRFRFPSLSLPCGQCFRVLNKCSSKDMNLKQLVNRQRIEIVSRFNARSLSFSPNYICRGFSTVATSASPFPEDRVLLQNPTFLKLGASFRRYLHSAPQTKLTGLSFNSKLNSDDSEEDESMAEFLSRFVHVMRGKLSDVYQDYDKQTIDSMLLIIVSKIVSLMEKGGIEHMIGASSAAAASQDFSEDLWRTVGEVSNLVLEDMEKECKKKKMRGFLQDEEVKEMCRFAGEIGIKGDMLRELRFKWAREKMEESEFYASLEKFRVERAQEKVEAGTNIDDTMGQIAVMNEEKPNVICFPKRHGRIPYKIYGLDLSDPKWVEVANKINETGEVIWPQEPKPVHGKSKLVTEKILSLNEEEDPSQLLAEWVQLLQPNRVDWMNLLEKLKKRSPQLYLKVAEHLLNETSFEPNVRDYSLLLEAYDKDDRVEDAERILKKMNENGITPDILTATILVHMHRKTGHVDRAKEVFESLRSHGFQPDIKIYNSMIMAYVNAGMPKLGESLTREMEARDIKPTEEIYMALLRSFSQHKDANSANQIVLAMQIAGFQPGLESFTLLIEAYGQTGDPDQARSNFDNMINVRRIRPDDRCIAGMIAAYERKNMLDDALKLLIQLEKDGFVTGTATYTVLLDWMCKLGLIDEAEALLGKIGQQGGTPPLKVHVSLCDLYSRAGIEKKALQVFGVLEAKKEQLGADDFVRIAAGLIAGGFRQEAQRVRDLMVAQGYTAPESLAMALMAAQTIDRRRPPKL